MYKKVECEIVGLSSNPTAGGAFALLLKEVYGNRQLPIIIGQFEAQAIAMELEGIKPPRPLTHDLIKSIIENAGASITEILISELRENTFIAKIVLEMSSLTNEVDARPSDAIAIALRARAPIYVAESVMEIASFFPSKNSEPFTEEIK
ncbi:MAG TPA: bifunctional nuclease family protein, partial [Ignavibacteriaceae bacterium]|nr:bifunctional nuclease family protein [Ignavibacteriaceae bacterium]